MLWILFSVLGELQFTEQIKMDNTFVLPNYPSRQAGERYWYLRFKGEEIEPQKG